MATLRPIKCEQNKCFLDLLSCEEEGKQPTNRRIGVEAVPDKVTKLEMVNLTNVFKLHVLGKMKPLSHIPIVDADYKEGKHD